MISDYSNINSTKYLITLINMIIGLSRVYVNYIVNIYVTNKYIKVYDQWKLQRKWNDD